MRFLKHPSRSPIGLDIGARHAKAVQLERCHISPRLAACDSSGWRFSAVACFPRARAGADFNPADVREIASVLFRRGFSGNRFVVAAPQDKLLTSALDVPARSAGVPVEQIVRMELARTHRCTPDSFEMGCWDLPAPARAKRNAQVMAVGCPHADADVYLDVFESAGLHVAGLDVRACALARAAAPLAPQDKAVCAILDVGWSSALLVMQFGGAIVYTRELADAGAKSLHEALAKRCGLESDVTDYLLGEAGDGEAENAESAPNLPPEARGVMTAYIESLTHELKISLDYVSHEYSETPLKRLLLTGSGASTRGLSGQLSASLELEAQVVRGAELAECPPGLLDAASSPALAAAIGLAQFTGE